MPIQITTKYCLKNTDIELPLLLKRKNSTKWFRVNTTKIEVKTKKITIWKTVNISGKIEKSLE